MGFLIISNLIHSVHETDLRASGKGNVAMEVMANCFLAMYAIDLATRLYVYRLEFFRSISSLFDGGIVLTDAILLALEQHLGNVPSVAVLRGVRMLRIVRVIRNMVAFRELYLMMLG